MGSHNLKMESQKTGKWEAITQNRMQEIRKWEAKTSKQEAEKQENGKP